MKVCIVLIYNDGLNDLERSTFFILGPHSVFVALRLLYPYDVIFYLHVFFSLQGHILQGYAKVKTSMCIDIVHTSEAFQDALHGQKHY